MGSDPKLIVLAGPNGAGKSTVAPSLLRDAFGLLEYVNADTIALGLSAFRPEGVAVEAGRVLLARVRQLARNRESFAFDSTLSGRSLARWIGRLKHESYGCHLLFLWLPAPEIAVARVRERVRAGGHDVSPEVVVRRYWRGLRNLAGHYRPLFDTWAVYDNGGIAAPVLLASGTSGGQLEVSAPEIWWKFREMAQWP